MNPRQIVIKRLRKPVFKTLSHLRNYLSINHLDAAASQKILKDYCTFITTVSLFEMKPTNKSWREHTFKDKTVAQSIEDIVNGVRHLIAWTLMQWDKGEAPWVIYYTPSLPKIAHKIMALVTDMGLPVNKILHVADHNIQAETKSMEGSNYLDNFFKKKKRCLSGDSTPKDFVFDKNTQIIIPASYRDDFRHKLNFIIENFRQIVSLQKDNGLTAENITVFFGMFDSERSLNDSPDYESSMDNSKMVDEMTEYLAEKFSVSVARSREFRETEYFQLADQLVNLILLENFQEFKNKLKPDVCGYLTICYGCQVTAQDKPKLSVRFSDANIVHLLGQGKDEDKTEIAVEPSSPDSAPIKASHAKYIPGLNRGNEEKPMITAESSGDAAPNKIYTVQERINSYLNYSNISSTTRCIFDAMFLFAIHQPNFTDVNADRLLQLAETLARRELAEELAPTELVEEFKYPATRW